MATDGKHIMPSVIMAKVFMAKVLWQMKLSHLSKDLSISNFCSEIKNSND